MSEPSTDANKRQQSPTSATQQTNPNEQPNLSRSRKWLFRLLSIFLGPAIVIGLLEVGLRIAGYGHPTDVLIDGTATEGKPAWIDNREFSQWIFPRELEQSTQPVPVIVPKVKAKNTFRIFVMGESAAMGFPDQSTSFCRVLETMLRAQFPDRHFEVINTSMVAINSHVVLQIARQCLDYQPDLFIVHLGNNEVVGPFGAAGVLGPFTPNLRLVRMNLAIKSTRSGQLLDRLVHWASKQQHKPLIWNGMTTFTNNQIRADDGRMTHIYSHFRQNLQDICHTARNAKVPVIICTIPVNLRDSAPFASLHNPGLDGEQLANWERHLKKANQLDEEKKIADAIASYRQAESIDSSYAELVFRLAQCLRAQGELELAHEKFVRARDLDALRFRADTTINEIIREVAAANRFAGVRLADADIEFMHHAQDGTPGEEFFLEHVHMNFHGNWQLARLLFEILTNPAHEAFGLPAIEATVALSEQQCAERLAHTDWDEFTFGEMVYRQIILAPPHAFQYDQGERCRRWEEKLDALQNRLKVGGYEKAATQYLAAVHRNEDDWMIRVNYAEFLTERGRHAEAKQQYREVLTRIRHYWSAYNQIGRLELAMKRPQAAENEFRTGMEHDPRNTDFALGLSEALERQGKNSEAQSALLTQLERTPHHVPTLRALGRLLFRAGRLPEAKARFSEALQLQPDSPDVLVELGGLELQQQELDEAIRLFEAALAIRPNWSELRRHLEELKKERSATGAARQN
jgi:tetratricopeptide (TPR) repeat protein